MIYIYAYIYIYIYILKVLEVTRDLNCEEQPKIGLKL